MKSFTLIETIVTIVIFTLLMGAVSGLILMLYRTHGYEWEQSLAIGEARKGIETMVKEIREARQGDDGSYPIEKASDKEFVFYSDIDKDGKAEKVRYFIATVGSGSQIQECQTPAEGGICSMSFSNFLKGTLISAQVKVSIDGDFGLSKEYADIYADEVNYLGRICRTGCADCTHNWQGTTIFDVKNFATDNSISIKTVTTSDVNPQECSYPTKVKVEFSFAEDLTGLAHEFKKGVIKPVGTPPAYPSDQEEIAILTSYVRNVPPIFEYFDQNGNKILDYPARLKDTKVIKVYLVVNVDPNRPPAEFQLESFVQLRNLKQE